MNDSSKTTYRVEESKYIYQSQWNNSIECEINFELISYSNSSIEKKSTSKSKKKRVKISESLKVNTNSIRVSSTIKKKKTRNDTEDSDCFSGDRKKYKSNKLIKTKCTTF